MRKHNIEKLKIKFEYTCYVRIKVLLDTRYNSANTFIDGLETVNTNASSIGLN